MFRPWQGWTALSGTGAGEGTLQVLPLLTLASAYIMLRPFFARRPGAPARSLAADEWTLDLESAAYPGSVPAKAQELDAASHPHLELAKTLVSIPRVEPGDQVYCEWSASGCLWAALRACQGTVMWCTRSRRSTRGRKTRRCSISRPSR